MNELHILGVRVRDFNKEEVFKLLDKAVEIGGKAHLVTLNPEFLVEARNNQDFKNVLNNAEGSTVDGMGLVFASILWGKRFRRLTGVRLTKILAKYSGDKGYKIYLLGGNSNTARDTATLLQKENDGIEIAYSEGSENVREETDEDRQREVEKINKYRPHILLVAYGSPHQDLWIDRNKDRLNANLMIGVGGTFDYLSGRTKRAPKWVRIIGMEWLVRLVKEPRRLKRIINAVFVFPVLVLFQRIGIIKE